MIPTALATEEFPAAAPVRRFTGETIWRRRAPWTAIDFEVGCVRIGGAAESATWQPEHKLFVTLAGGTRRTEAQVEGGRRYVGADTPGAVSFIPAGRRRRGWYSGERFTVANIALPTATIAAALGPSVELPRLDFIAVDNGRDPYIHQLALALQDELENGGAAGPIFVETVAAALSLHLVRRYSTLSPVMSPVAGGLTPATLHRLLAYIDDSLVEDVSLAAMARVARMSIDSLARAFKQATGLPPHRYVMVRRLERAKDLLADSGLSLAEIAYATGFSSQSHFASAFRRHVGATPRAFRASERRRILAPFRPR